MGLGGELCWFSRGTIFLEFKIGIGSKKIVIHCWGLNFFQIWTSCAHAISATNFHLNFKSHNIQIPISSHSQSKTKQQTQEHFILTASPTFWLVKQIKNKIKINHLMTLEIKQHLQILTSMKSLFYSFTRTR